MKRILYGALLAASVIGCQSVAPSTAAEEVVISSGTSFGMCLEYCITELRLTEREARFTEQSRDPALPERTRTMPMTEERWSALLAAIDEGTLAALEEVYGCPDCADGGAEWLEVSTPRVEKRVTLEHGAALPEIAALLEQTRALRERFLAQE